MIKIKEGACSCCNKTTKLIAKMCQYCYWNSRRKNKSSIEKKPIQKKVCRIAKLSSKRKAETVLYLKKKLNFMEQNKYCQAKLSNCTRLSTDVHHKAGRIGSLLTDETYFLSVCRTCHNYIEEHPIFAKENGFSVSRLEISTA